MIGAIEQTDAAGQIRPQREEGDAEKSAIRNAAPAAPITREQIEARLRAFVDAQVDLPADYRALLERNIWKLYESPSEPATVFSPLKLGPDGTQYSTSTGVTLQEQPNSEPHDLSQDEVDNLTVELRCCRFLQSFNSLGLKRFSDIAGWADTFVAMGADAEEAHLLLAFVLHERDLALRALESTSEPQATDWPSTPVGSGDAQCASRPARSEPFSCAPANPNARLPLLACRRRGTV